ncbi:hypothetical protein HU738_003375 [Pseudomonas sp. RW4S2]|uniref:Uncharacterized protein n=2 Tax=Pseudomonas vlassakiae TaxID=485888 RepID=A0A923GH26_9PSED|nr:hypothetical protein [Pseudomonas vlassakiae]
MANQRNSLPPGRETFAQDPFAHSALGAMKWETASLCAGYPIDPSITPLSEQLKNPVLWMTQAHAMSEAASAVLLKEQKFSEMPLSVREVCESQYCAIAMMLIGYSLEVSLKAMIIVEKGIEGYTQMGKKTLHHRLDDLASFLPDLSKKDRAILRGLSHFISWAGRYPDPGTGKEHKLEEIFDLGEKHQVTAFDLFNVCSRVMRHAQTVVNQAQD